MIYFNNNFYERKCILDRIIDQIEEKVEKYMNNYIDLKPVSELLGMSFFIPSYQRGYRWTKEQITDLLDDFYSFAIKPNKSKEEFYCLQPVIVKKRNISNSDDYEVIDGQQRLTTIRILLSYLVKSHLNNMPLEDNYDNPLYTIKYETRQDSTEFLDNIKVNENNNIDFYHIAKAYEYIENWFENKKKKREVKESILRTLVLGKEDKKEEGIIQVIWYEIREHNTNPIDTFIRINLGKISLTNAELIKALFLQERNFGDGDIAKLKQLEIAQKWDRIENKMQEENFWWFLNKEENNSSSHIEFIFDMICNMEDTMKEIIVNGQKTTLDEIIGNDQNRTFRYYAYRFGDSPNHETIKTLWSEIEEKFETLQEWYLTHEWYHYVGFLIYCGKSVQEIMNLLNANSIVTKEHVTTILINEIKKEFKGIKWISNNNKELHLDLDYNSDKDVLRKFFLLFNLEYINKQSNNKNLIYYFPFKSFKIGKSSKELIAWDIEHVNSATENTLEKLEDKKVWLENVKQDIKNISNDCKKEIDCFLTNDECEIKFETLQDKIIEIAGEHTISEELKNCIGNLTLLDAGTNRGYGNSLFPTKRRIIIQKDQEGTFIPLCTKNVFLKYFDGNVQSEWLEQDIISYRRILESTMEKYIPKKEGSHV